MPCMVDFDLALSTPAKCERRLMKSDLKDGIVQVPPHVIEMKRTTRPSSAKTKVRRNWNVLKVYRIRMKF